MDLGRSAMKRFIEKADIIRSKHIIIFIACLHYLDHIYYTVVNYGQCPNNACLIKELTGHQHLMTKTIRVVIIITSLFYVSILRSGTCTAGLCRSICVTIGKEACACDTGKVIYQSTCKPHYDNTTTNNKTFYLYLECHIRNILQVRGALRKYIQTYKRIRTY